MFSNKVIQEDVENENKMSMSGSSVSNVNKMRRSRKKITFSLLPSVKQNSDHGNLTDPGNEKPINKKELSMPLNLLSHDLLDDLKGNYLIIKCE